MRAAPAVQLDIETGLGWRLALWVVFALASVSTTAWAIDTASVLAWAAVALLLLCGAALAWRSRRPGRARLGWDGAGWTLLEAGQREARRGEVEVRIDLGDALLLRFVPDTGARWRGRWLPLQRSMGAPWHALRCALYSPRPVATGEPG